MMHLHLVSLQRELENRLINDNNIHRIAISNIKDPKIQLERWWRKKYRIPPKDFEEYTSEELYLEYYEDYYDRYPEKIEEFLAGGIDDEEWDGTHDDPELEAAILKRLTKLNLANPDIIKKYQTPGDENMSDEKFQDILNNLGKKLPGSKKKVKKKDNEEFEDNYLG